jgi:hypothetical protein
VKPVKARWLEESAPRLLSPTTLGTLAQSLENGLKAEGLMRRTLKGTAAEFSKAEKQIRHAAIVNKQNRRLIEK